MCIICVESKHTTAVACMHELTFLMRGFYQIAISNAVYNKHNRTELSLELSAQIKHSTNHSLLHIYMYNSLYHMLCCVEVFHIAAVVIVPCARKTRCLRTDTNTIY